MSSIVVFVKRLEDFFFRYRAATLLLLLLLTIVMGILASRLHMSAGFDKQLPVGHEYTDTFFKYRTELFGANRVMVVVRSTKGEIWTPEALKKLHQVTEAVLFLPGVDRRSVQSLWTPNTRVYELTEEGLSAEDLIGGTVTPDALNTEQISCHRAITAINRPSFIGRVAVAIETAPVTTTPAAMGKRWTIGISTARSAK